MRQAARIEDLVARFAAVRETVGWEIDLGVELHRNMTAGDAVLLTEELARLRPLFVEDPIPPDSVVALRAFAAKVSLPVAAGERNTTIWEFAEYLERPGVAYVRPDVGIAGGITHVKKICALAEAFNAGVLPARRALRPRRGRSPRAARDVRTELGAAGARAAGRERWTDLVDQVVEVRDGYLVAPDRPGLGIDLDDSGIAKHPPTPAGFSGSPLREDGSVAIR